MDSNQQNNSKDQTPPVEYPSRVPDPMPKQNVFERIAGIFADAAQRFGKDHVSKHAAGRAHPADASAKRRRLRRISQASRKRNRPAQHRRKPSRIRHERKARATETQLHHTTRAGTLTKQTARFARKQARKAAALRRAHKAAKRRKRRIANRHRRRGKK